MNNQVPLIKVYSVKRTTKKKAIETSNRDIDKYIKYSHLFILHL